MKKWYYFYVKLDTVNIGVSVYAEKEKALFKARKRAEKAFMGKVLFIAPCSLGYLDDLKVDVI